MSADQRPYITCRELLDFLYLYLENELPGDRRIEFERHLGVCDPCREYIRQYEQSIRLGRSAFADPDRPAADEAPEELVEAILRARTKA
jgi:anti-sigma factor RsiW